MVHKTITVIGNVGSGKTTLAKILAEKLSAIYIDAEMYTLNPFLPLYVKDHTRWALATELFFTLERAKYLKTELSKNESKTKIIDSGLLMGIEVYAKHHYKAGTMTKEEWVLFKKLTIDSVNSKLIYPNLLSTVAVISVSVWKESNLEVANLKLIIVANISKILKLISNYLSLNSNDSASQHWIST